MVSEAKPELALLNIIGGLELLQKKEIDDHMTRLELRCLANTNKTAIAIAAKRLLQAQPKNNRTVLTTEFIKQNKVCYIKVSIHLLKNYDDDS